MHQAREHSPALRAMIASAAVIILLGGMKLASGLLAPIIFAVFVAILCLPLMRWLQQKGLPTWAALLLLIAGVLALGVVLIMFIFLALSQLRDNLPHYQAQLTALVTQIQARFASFDIDLSTTIRNLFDPATIISTITSVLSQALNGLLLALLILVGVVFTMLESRRFGMKLRPNIGIIIACVPAVALALIQHGIGVALVVVVGLTAINYIGDYAITPRLMSQGLGLSQFTVFFSFFVWAYIFGAIGGLLSVPLTLLVKLLLETSDDTRWLAMLMDDNVPVAAAATNGAQATHETAASPISMEKTR